MASEELEPVASPVEELGISCSCIAAYVTRLQRCMHIWGMLTVEYSIPSCNGCKLKGGVGSLDGLVRALTDKQRHVMCLFISLSVWN